MEALYVPRWYFDYYKTFEICIFLNYDLVVLNAKFTPMSFFINICSFHVAFPMLIDRERHIPIESLTRHPGSGISMPSASLLPFFPSGGDFIEYKNSIQYPIRH